MTWYIQYIPDHFFQRLVFMHYAQLRLITAIEFAHFMHSRGYLLNFHQYGKSNSFAVENCWKFIQKIFKENRRSWIVINRMRILMWIYIFHINTWTCVICFKNLLKLRKLWITSKIIISNQLKTNIKARKFFILQFSDSWSFIV